MLEFQKKLKNSFYVLLSLPATAMGLALSIQIAVLSWILTTKYGLDIHEVGFVWAAGPLAGILGQPIIGLISDKVWFWGGRRRPFIIIGGFLAAFSILALPNIDQIADLFGIASLMGVAITIALTLDLSINISFNPTRSIIADVTPEGATRTKGYTWMQSFSNLFGSLAYLVGAIFSNYVLIYTGAFVVICFSIIPLFFIEEPIDLSKDNEKKPLNTPDSEIAKETAIGKTNWAELMKIYFAHSFSWLGIQTMFVYIIAFLQQKMFTPDVYEKYQIIQELKKVKEVIPDNLQQINDLVATETGRMISISFFLLNAIGVFLPVFFLEPLTKRIGQVRTHYLAVAVMSIGYFLIAMFARSELLLYSFIAIVSIGWSAVVSLPFAIMTEKVDKSKMGFFMGIFNLSVVLPQLVVSLAIGYFILNAENKAFVFFFATVCLAVSSILWTFVKDNRNTTASTPIIRSGH